MYYINQLLKIDEAVVYQHSANLHYKAAYNAKAIDNSNNFYKQANPY